MLSAPLLCPLDYSRDFILYLAASESTIRVVLVQEDDSLVEHVIYYLSCALAGPELRYSHVEKLALAAVYAVQRLRHYILLRTTTIVADVNPFQYVDRLLGENSTNGLSFSRSLTWIFNPLSLKSP